VVARRSRARRASGPAQTLPTGDITLTAFSAEGTKPVATQAKPTPLGAGKTIHSRRKAPPVPKGAPSAGKSQSPPVEFTEPGVRKTTTRRLARK